MGSWVSVCGGAFSGNWRPQDLLVLHARMRSITALGPASDAVVYPSCE